MTLSIPILFFAKRNYLELLSIPTHAYSFASFVDAVGNEQLVA